MVRRGREALTAPALWSATRERGRHAYLRPAILVLLDALLVLQAEAFAASLSQAGRSATWTECTCYLCVSLVVALGGALPLVDRYRLWTGQAIYMAMYGGPYQKFGLTALGTLVLIRLCK
jgi:hypothetical protein